MPLLHHHYTMCLPCLPSFPHTVKFLANTIGFYIICKDYDSINQHSHPSTTTPPTPTGGDSRNKSCVPGPWLKPRGEKSLARVLRLQVFHMVAVGFHMVAELPDVPAAKAMSRLEQGEIGEVFFFRWNAASNAFSICWRPRLRPGAAGRGVLGTQRPSRSLGIVAHNKPRCSSTVVACILTRALSRTGLAEM